MGTDLLADALLTMTNFAIAVLIGATAIGGLLLAPSLNLVGGIPIHAAIPNCMFTFIFTGLAGAAIFGRRGEISFTDLKTLTIGAGLSALVGAFALTLIPPLIVQVIIAFLCIASGAYALIVRHEEPANPRQFSRNALLAIGSVTGFGSALTGTGGPLILMPILLAMRYGLKPAVGLAQAIQVPVAVLATVGNVAMGRVKFEFAVPLTIVIVLGAIVGALLTKRVSAETMRLWVAALLVVSGLAYTAKIF